MAKKRVAPSADLVDSVPVEIIGRILSCMTSARNVALASATCYKWREAAKKHLLKLSFDNSDFCSRSGDLQRRPCERVITEVLTRTESLCELSIFFEGYVNVGESGGVQQLEFEAAAVTVWLQHAKKTLKSLTLMNPIMPSMNILNVLFGGESNLKYLEWGCAYIPSVDPTIHRFESLISLTLYGMEDWLAASNLEALLTVSPKLESLSLVDIDVRDPTRSYVVFKSSSLKSLTIAHGFSSIQEIILHIDCLKSLELMDVGFEQVKFMECRRQQRLCCLKLENANIKELDLGEPADSLNEFHLRRSHDLEVEWAKYHLVISSSRHLEKLYLFGLVSHGNDIGLDKIGSLFPCLNFLALEYRLASKAFKCGGSAEGLILESITILELSTYKFNKQFAGCIAGFLKLCPNLKRLTVSGKISHAKSEPAILRMAEFFSLMMLVMRPYPNISMKYYFF